MGICSNEIATVFTTYDCVKICEGPVYPAPKVEYKIDLDAFTLNATALEYYGDIMYKWVIKDGEYKIYDSGFDLPSAALPLIGNGSTYKQFLLGTEYADFKNMLNIIAPFYVSRELKFELYGMDQSNKTSDVFDVFFLSL